MTLVANALANIVIGGPTLRTAGVPVLSPFNAIAVACQFYVINNAAGYSKGTGGTVQVRLCADGGGCPGVTLTVGMIIANPAFPNPSSGKGYFPLAWFTSPVQLVKGDMYWLVFENIDRETEENYQSLDLLIGPPGQFKPAPMWKDGNGPWQSAAVGAPPMAGVFTLSPVVLYTLNGPIGHAGCEVENGQIIGAYQYGFPKELPL